MTFGGKNRDRYNVWRKTNLRNLILAGVPERIANNNRLFWLVVQEGEKIGDGGGG